MYKETIRAVGRRLAWGRVGSGPPLLLVNGYAATGADWDPGFLHGAEDRVIPAANAEPLAQRWDAGRAELFDGCGHAVMAQQPAAVASRLREFFVGV